MITDWSHFDKNDNVTILAPSKMFYVHFGTAHYGTYKPHSVYKENKSSHLCQRKGARVFGLPHVLYCNKEYMV